MRNAFLAASLVIASAMPVFAAQSTVNSYTPAQEAHAKGLVVNAGYKPTQLAMVQDGNFFFTATKGDQEYEATVTRGGKVYFSTGLPMNQSPAG